MVEFRKVRDDMKDRLTDFFRKQLKQVPV